MVNFNTLQNITALNINTSLVNNTEEFLPNMVNNANEASGGYFGLGILLAMFIFIMIVTFKDNGDIRLDIVRSMLVAGGISGVIGTVLLYATIIISFQHVMWFFIIWFVMLISTVFLKKRGN